MEQITKDEFNSMLHSATEDKRAMVMLFEDKDGNWRGGYYKKGFDTPVYVRDIGPETVLQLLLTHDGK